MKKREYRDYLIDIATSINDIESFVEGMTYDDFLNSKMASNAVIRSLEVIGEATKNLPEAIRDRDTSIPWKKMAGMRDKIIHEYFGVNYETVWKTAKNILPGLKDKISHLIEQKISGDK